MSSPTGDNDDLNELESEVEAELTLAESGRPDEQVSGVPIEEWLVDPAEAERDEVALRSLLGAVETMEEGSRTGEDTPRVDPPPTS